LLFVQKGHRMCAVRYTVQEHNRYSNLAWAVLAAQCRREPGQCRILQQCGGWSLHLRSWWRRPTADNLLPVWSIPQCRRSGCLSRVQHRTDVEALGPNGGQNDSPRHAISPMLMLA
jgi:hypothetical protein